MVCAAKCKSTRAAACVNSVVRIRVYCRRLERASRLRRHCRRYAYLHFDANFLRTSYPGITLASIEQYEGIEGTAATPTAKEANRD